jgi:acyl-CoA synthetase (AMP-forming)/AMP-acid ligase II
MSAERFVDPGPPVSFSCLRQLLEHQAKRIPDAPAILAPGRAPLTYGRLYQHIENMGCGLRAMGIGRHDRIAAVLPNGPEMAVAILSVAASATCAPMNPAHRTEELDRYFADLRPRALIAQAGIDTPARRAALSRGVRVIELSTALDAEAGLFTLQGDQGGAPSHESVSPGNVALLMPTSGTTSRPKIVPQTHAKVCASAYATGAALALRETDRCLNILPLFHGHGLIATVMASLAAGASVVCAPTFDVNSFSAWLTAFQPTWYSAVPAMHQAILGQARHTRDRLSESRLRFVRSSSAPLPRRIFADLEQSFETCVIEWYGMTEVAASPITCNPQPPRPRKPGSVGIPVALDVTIIGEEGALLPGGQTGEVVVRGASVMAGYDGDPMATAAAFAGDWFKTGDLGFFDDDGYLFLTGRTREMINRGGEKVAPREVDEVLLEHPAVAEAVTFAVPHATLGEDVASAIVLRPDVLATPKEIRHFAIGRIAEFKVPRQVLIVSQIPKGPTGKVQRIGLAAKLGLATSDPQPQPLVAPRTTLEEVLAKRWAEILQVDQIGIHDDFFVSGGDSLLATLVLCHVYDVAQIELEVSRFFDAPTVAEVAHHLERMIHADQAPRRSSAIVRVPRENGLVPASAAQERLWKLQHALPDLPYFNVLYALRLTSPCDVPVLERSINEIVRRHEILRTTLAIADGRYVQVIAPRLIVTLGFDDLRALPRSKKETIGHQFIQEEVLHSFDLAKGPLIRARLMHLAEREHLLLISMHQVVCDGWSIGVFVKELIALYDAFSAQEESPLAPLSIQYADFAHWQRDWQSHPKIVAQLAYWREQLREPLPVIQLAISGPRQTIDDLQTARRGWALPASLAEAAKRFSHQEGGTLFMALVAALKTLLHRYLGEDDMRVATNIANRNRPGTEGLIGPLVNTLILRTHLGGDPTAREVMRRVRTTTLAAFAHQDLPFEQLAETLERERALRPESLAKIMILLQNATLRPAARCSSTFACEEANPNMILPLVTTTTFDVIVALCESSVGLVGTCIYKRHLFGAKAIDRLLRDFEKTIEQMVTQPERPISSIRISRKRNDRAGK